MTTQYRTRTVLTLAVVVVSIGAMAGSASASVLVYEPFAYADGWLTGQGGALGTTGTWTADDYYSGDWRIHQEGETSGVVVDPGPPVVRNMFDGTVDNLITSGGYVGVPGPLDLDPPRGEDEDFEIARNMSADIGLDPSVTATFQSGTTTWISYVSVRGWDRNEEHPNLVLGTDPAPAQSRGDNYGGIGTGGSGFGTGGGPTRNNRTDIYPMYYDVGQYMNVTGAISGNSYGDSAHEVSEADSMDWEEFTAGGEFGPANIVVMKLEWDADTGGEDIISVVRFLETDELSEAAFDALITAQPNLSSANWSANKPSLDQSQLDTITFMGLKVFVDEIRIGTTFDDVMGTAVDPNLPTVLTGSNWVTWSGETVTLDPNVVNNDEEPQRNLTYAWSADAVSMADDNLDITITPDVVDPADAKVLIIKTDPTGDATVVTMTLAVTLEGEGPILDTMRIYVYDDSCEAAKGIGSVVIGAGDFNGSCFTDFEDFAVLAAAWLIDYDVADLLMFIGTWLDGDVLTAPVIASVTVPDVTGGSESAAQSILTGLGLTTSSTYQFDQVVPLNDVITQNPIAGTEVPDGINVSLVVSNGLPPVSELTIAGVYLAQTHVLRPDDPLFKLVGNRPTLLKVQVVAPNGTAVPTVTVVLSVDSETTTLTLDGPDTLPGAFEAALGKVQHLYDDSFTTLIPAEWIRPGLNISVTAGTVTVDHDIKVGAPTELKMKMFDVHYFGLGNNDYPAGAFDELEAKWPAASLDIERIRDIDFYELVVPARGGAPYVRVTSKQDYLDQTGLNFDGEQAAALQWVGALSASGGNFDVAMQYINIIGVPAGGQAGGFDGVGGISLGILNHELGHALSLPHWGDNSSYPYKGEMYGIEPQPGVYMGTHVGPTWAFDLPSMTFIPPTVQENSVGGEVGYYKKSPMQGGGVGDQEVGFFFRHFSDFGVNRMQSYIEGKVAVFRDGNHYKWDDQDGDYTRSVTSDGVRYPIEHDVQVISLMASTTLSDMNVNMVYPPIGPYEGNLILTFDPTNASDRATADAVFCPSGGCDFTLRVVQGGQQKTYMLAASGTVGGDPYSNSSLKTAAVNLRASDGTVTQVELLLTPNAEKDGLPDTPEVLHIWTD